MPVNKVRLSACFIIILCTSCNGKVTELTSNKGDSPRESPRESGTSYYLDSKKPSIVQPIEPIDRVQDGCKFVQTDVTQVQNPKKYTVTFKVHYQLEGNEKIYLGSFTLYPSDHPGKFIVATQGKLRNEGAIVLSLVIPDDFDSRDTIRVAVKRMKCLKE